MGLLRGLFAFLHRLTDPQALNLMAADMGGWLYVILFTIVFCETGLVVFPFLPGDSLHFAIGAMGAQGSSINLFVIGPLLILAAVAGNTVNYSIGLRVGPAVFRGESSRLLNKKHLEEAHAFYEKYGGKTIFLAQFVPIIRTFAPFIAGVGKMNYFKFAAYNVSGAITWVTLLMGAGRLFGGIPWVKRNFEMVIVAIIVISVLPAVLEFLRGRAKGRREAAAE